jgi:hypothetical protein
MSDVTAPPRWRVLLAPRWLGWHLFAVAAVAGMLWLGDWQFRRAESGNPLSWAYTFEWPVFAVFGVVFWIKTVRDELKPPACGAEPARVQLPAGVGSAAKAGQGRPAGADDEADPVAATELAEYNAYLAKLNSEVRRHGKWHGLR